MRRAPSYRDLWLSEMWPTCPEWHQTRDERDDARERNATLNTTPQAVDEPPENVDWEAS